MYPINLIDTSANLLGAAAVWEDTRAQAIRAGVDPEAAKAMADAKVERVLLRSAQPTLRLARSEFEQRVLDNPLSAFFALFVSEPRKNLAITYMAVRELVTGKGTAGKPMAAQQAFVGLAALATRTHTPADELRELLLDAALSAVETSIATRGGVTLPLELTASHGEISPDAPSTLPVYLPAAAVQLLRELCQAADIEAGPDWMIEDMVSSSARDSLLSKTPSLNGAPDIIASMWDLRDEELSAMQAVVDRWNAGEGDKAKTQPRA